MTILAGCATAPVRESQIVGTGTMPTVTSSTYTAPYRTATESQFAWPVRGEVLASFGDTVNMVTNKGIDIKAREGSAVKASKSGKVVYSDPFMKGFGNTVILDHGNGYQTVYSYNSRATVKVGDRVRQSDVIAYSGSTGRASQPSLHFEIRKDGKPLDPKYYLR